MRKNNIFKLAFFVVFTVIAFAGIHWYTNPSRCASNYDGELRDLFSDNKAYDMCTNYYNVPVFKNNALALKIAKEDYKDVFDYIKNTYKLGDIDSSNYEFYLTASLEIGADLFDSSNQIDQFLSIYDNGLKRAKPYLECEFIKTFYVIDAMEQYINEKDYSYVILRNPDTMDPMMIKLDNDIKEDFITGKYFEVTFRSDINYKSSYNDYVMLFENLKINSIQETEKLENEQLQQNGCR